MRLVPKAGAQALKSIQYYYKCTRCRVVEGIKVGVSLFKKKHEEQQ